MTSNQQINSVFPNELYSSDFLFYFLSFISPKIKLGASEQAVPKINKTEFSKTLIAFPTKSEQTAIATALSDADALMKLIAKKRNIKRGGAMQRLLTPNKNWNLKKLGDILKKTQLGGNYSNTETITSFPLIKMGNIQRGFISTKKIEYIIGNNIPEQKDRLNYGDVLFKP